jgi:uncharacterized HAD superfamily protein
MIQIDTSQIGYVTSSEFVKYKEECKAQLEGEPQFDLILDCNKKVLAVKELKKVFMSLKANARILVIIVSKDDLDTLPVDWNVVPTLEEAKDFISFERMQRDLGF